MSAQFNGASDTVRSYEYDPASRLTGYADVIFEAPDCAWDEDEGFQCTSASQDTVGTDTYTYDRVGNRTDSGAQVVTGNRLTAFDGWTLEWDAAGQLTRKYDGTSDRRFYWNALGQLDSVSVDGTVTRFTYDEFGRRIARQGPVGTVEQVYDGEDPFWELDGSGALEAEYSFYPGVDRPHSVKRGGSTYYYARDDLGSVMALFDGAGTVVNRYRYDPWGQATSASEGVTNPFRFTGREWDAETGLQYHRARYYDPGLGRFISEDPIGLAGGINPYAYTANSPTNAVDPTGTCTVTVWIRYWKDTGEIISVQEIGREGCNNLNEGSSGPSSSSFGAAGGGPSAAPADTTDIGEIFEDACQASIGLATIYIGADLATLATGFTKIPKLTNLGKTYLTNRGLSQKLTGLDRFMRANLRDMGREAGSGAAEVGAGALATTNLTSSDDFLGKLKDFGGGLVPLGDFVNEIEDAVNLCNPS